MDPRRPLLIGVLAALVALAVCGPARGRGERGLWFESLWGLGGADQYILRAAGRLLMPGISLVMPTPDLSEHGEYPWKPPYREPPPSSEDLCVLRGYRCEKHIVETDDGYQLAVIHVLGSGRQAEGEGEERGDRVPVLVQHGMLMSSDAFMLRQDDGNLPFVLDAAGYDVWVGNYRGNAVSPHRHKNLSETSFAFWDYSWHELGLHDLPAMVDFVLERTGQQDLQYIGHSMGTTGMTVLLSSSPEYNRKVRLASYLAPVAYVSGLRSRFFKKLSAIAPVIKRWLYLRKMWNVLPRSARLHRLANLACVGPNVVGDGACNAIGYEIAGVSPRHTQPNHMALLAAYLPAGTTIRIMEHYYEVARTGKFRPLGKGTGDPDPGPEYNVSAITAPVALYYSKNDLFIQPRDVDRLAEDLPNMVRKYLVPDATFNHFDFLFSPEASRLLYSEMIRTMKKVDSHHVNKVRRRRW